MVSQLEQYRKVKTFLEDTLNQSSLRVPPLNGEDGYEMCKRFYGNLNDDDILYIRRLPPDLQQETLRMNLKRGLNMFNDTIKDLEDQGGLNVFISVQSTVAWHPKDARLIN